MNRDDAMLAVVAALSLAVLIGFFSMLANRVVL